MFAPNDRSRSASMNFGPRNTASRNAEEEEIRTFPATDVM